MLNSKTFSCYEIITENIGNYWFKEARKVMSVVVLQNVYVWENGNKEKCYVLGISKVYTKWSLRGKKVQFGEIAPSICINS